MYTAAEFAAAVAGEIVDRDGLPGVAEECGSVETSGSAAAFVAYGYDGEEFTVIVTPRLLTQS